MPEAKRPTPVTPYLTVRGGQDAIEFYKKAFGARTARLMMAEDKQRVMHASLTINGGMVMLSDAFDEYGDAGGTKPPTEVGGASVTVHLDTDNVDRAWKKAVDAGAEILMPLADMFWGDRYGVVRDPFGHVWSMAAPVKKPASQAAAKPAARKKAAKKKVAKKNVAKKKKR
jgi:PhnB protein